MICRICLVPIQPRKHVLFVDHAHYTAPTRQHDLDHTDHTDHTDQEYTCPERSRSWNGNRSYRSYKSHRSRRSCRSCRSYRSCRSFRSYRSYRSYRSSVRGMKLRRTHETICKAAKKDTAQQVRLDARAHHIAETEDETQPNKHLTV